MTVLVKSWINSIVKRIRSISQKNKFYRRAESKFLYTMRNQRGIFYLLHWECELKILCINVKLAYLDIYFTEKHVRRRHTWLVLLRLQHFSCFSNLALKAAKIIDYIEKCFKQKLRRIKFSAKNSVEADLYLPQEWN